MNDHMSDMDGLVEVAAAEITQADLNSRAMHLAEVRDALLAVAVLERQRDALAAKVADAWDEGWRVGASGRTMPNPYRAALTEGTEG